MMMASTWGTMAAAESPCRTRATMSSSMLGAGPQPSEVTTNRAVPRRNIFLRPTMSPSLPPVTSPSANASVYPAMVISMAAEPPPRSAWIAGAARTTIPLSRKSMKAAVNTVTRTASPRPVVRAAPAGGRVSRTSDIITPPSYLSC